MAHRWHHRNINRNQWSHS